MASPIEIIRPTEGPFAGKVLIVTSEENFAKFQDVLKSTMGAMSGASKVRDLVQGGLGQLFAAAALFKAGK
jgi:hypothetical protein